MADSDSVWLFSRHIPLGMTIAMTPGEALRVLHKPSSVVGCYEVHRTLSEDRRATDPNGDKAYRAATRKPPFVPMQRASASTIADGATSRRWSSRTATPSAGAVARKSSTSSTCARSAVTARRNNPTGSD